MLVRRFVFLLSFVFVWPAAAAHAQLRNSDAYFGYSRLGSDAFYRGAGGLNGWQAALHLHLHPFLGAEADVAHYGLGASPGTPRTTTAMVGPRVTLKALGVALFVHGLVGGEHSANSSGSVSGTALTYDLGGGVDLPILPFFAWRFGADRISAPSQSPSEGTQARFNTGLVFRF